MSVFSPSPTYKLVQLMSACRRHDLIEAQMSANEPKADMGRHSVGCALLVHANLRFNILVIRKSSIEEL